MRSFSYLLTTGLAISLIFSSCTSQQSSPPFPCAVENVLKNRCWNCHGETPGFGAEFSLYTWADTQGAAPSATDVPLWQMMDRRIHDKENPMPPKALEGLSEEELSILEGWIAFGAPSGASGLDSISQEYCPSTQRVFSLDPGEFAEANLWMYAGDEAWADFSTEIPILWDVHSHRGEVVSIESGKSDSGRITHKSSAENIISFWWKNTDTEPLSLEVKIESTGRTRLFSWFWGEDKND